MKAWERLINYVTVRTPSDEESETVPSSVCQILPDRFPVLFPNSKRFLYQFQHYHRSSCNSASFLGYTDAQPEAYAAGSFKWKR